MTQPSDNFKKDNGFFHSVSKTQTESTQYTFNSGYTAGHVVFSKDVLTQTLPFCNTSADVDAFIVSNPTILKKFTQVSLVEIVGSNGQAWRIDDAGTWRKPIILPSLVPNLTSNEPSNGFLPKLYKQDNTFISPSTGVWLIDPYQGIVKFEVGYTPADLGWGIPKLTCYAYTGQTLTQALSGGSGPVDDSNFVHKTGIESISGQKTFVDTTTFNSEINENGSYVATANANGISSNATIDIFPAIKGTAGFWDILITDSGGLNMRASRVFAIWKNSTLEINYVESSTVSIGITEGVSLIVVYRNANADIALRASVTSGIWNIKTSRKLL
jgi:hypothetical protein